MLRFVRSYVKLSRLFCFQWPLDAEKGLDIFGKIKKTPRRCLSDPGEIDEDCKPRNMKLGPRYSLPFLCKTDLDLIKEMNGEQFQDRRTSLLMMNERNRARHSMVEGYGGEKSERKISTNSLNEGKQYRRKMAQHKTDDINQVSRMTSLPVPASGVSDNCHNVSSNIKSPDTRKLKGISTSHVLWESVSNFKLCKNISTFYVFRFRFHAPA